MGHRRHKATGAPLAKGAHMSRKHAYDAKAHVMNADGVDVIAREGRFGRVGDIERWARHHFGEVELVRSSCTFLVPGRTDVAIYYTQAY